jgi:PKD repeat protein
MKNIIITTVLFLFTFYTVEAQDLCTGATTINCGNTMAGSTVGFGADVAPFCGTGDGTGGGIWYQSTATCTGMTASLCAGSTFDTKLRVFSGTCGALVCVGGIDDFCGLQSEVSWASTPGVTYYILVHGYGGSEGPYSLALTCTGCCATNPPTADFSAPTTVCTGAAATFSDISSCNPTSWSWSFPGGTPATSTAQNPVVTYPAIGTYNVTLTATNAYGSDVEVKNAYINVINCAGSCVGNYYYIRSNAGSPWGSTSNETAMNAVFGAGVWTQGFFETVNAATLFSAATCTIYMDGSDAGATAMETFLTANMTAMENWVAAGGKIFLNSAPNQDNGMNYGFGGTSLVYSGATYPTGNAVVPAHAIFTGPFLPVGLTWTGNWFCHGNIGAYGSALIDGSGVVICSEKFWGAGVAVFGSMTTANWHTPAPEGQNLRQNILCYISPPIICGVPLGIELTTFTGENFEGSNILKWTTKSEVSNNFFTVERSLNGSQFNEVGKVNGAGNSSEVINYSLRDDNPYAGVNYYRLKQTDYDGAYEYSNTIALDNTVRSEITVFPSPADEMITISLVEKPAMAANVTIRDAVGHEMITMKMNKRVESFNISELPSGIYFISITIGGETYMHKISVN